MATLAALIAATRSNIKARLAAFVPTFQVKADAVFKEYSDEADQTNPFEQTPTHARSYRLGHAIPAGPHMLGKNIETAVYYMDLMVWYPRSRRWQTVALDDITRLRYDLDVNPYTANGVQWRGFNHGQEPRVDKHPDDPWDLWVVQLALHLDVDHS